MTNAVSETESIPKLWTTLVREVEADMSRRLDLALVPDTLRDAMRYALFGGGKRLRPLLTLMSCEAVGGDRTDAFAAAGALELIHTFSLIHDDLPAMDDDALRRGQPTLHLHAGEAMAILAGDCLHALAFEWVAAAPVPAEVVAPLGRELAGATVAMIAGQVYDTLGGFAEAVTPRDRLESIHRHKTTALLRAAVRMGGLCGGADEKQLGALTAYGEAIGTMFQIVDDLLDVTQTTEHLGKTAGKDQQAGKLTWPGLHGAEASHAAVERLHRESREALEVLGEPARHLGELCDYMAVRTR